MSTLKTINIEHLDAISPSIVVNAAGGIQVGGALTATTGTFSGNVSVAGVLSYEDVANIDSVGIITAQAGVNVTGGRVLIGTTIAPTVVPVSGSTLVLQGYVGSATGDSLLSLQRGQAPADISSGAQLGGISFGANNGSQYAQIAAFSDGAGGPSDYPGKIVFSTTADTGSAPAPRLSIDSGGDLQITDGNLKLAAGRGVDFSANSDTGRTVTANVLSDFEQGTFTPTFINYGSPTVSVAEGEYVKIGGSVFLSIRMTWTGGSNNGNTRISGLPFAMTDAHIKVNGWAQKGSAEGSAVYRLATTGISNTAIFYQPIRDETSGVFYGTIQITSL